MANLQHIHHVAGYDKLFEFKQRRADRGPNDDIRKSRHAANRFTFMDQEAIGMLSGGFIEQPDQTSFWWVVPGARDKGNGANVAFADGSCRSIRRDLLKDLIWDPVAK